MHQLVAKGAPRQLTDRAVVLTGGALMAVAALAWVGVLRQAMALPSPMPDRGTFAMDDAPSLTGAVGFLVAWSVMMAAMMLPSATPMIALYGSVYRGQGAAEQRAVPTVLFALTYGVVWAALGVPVYLTGLALGALSMGSDAVMSALPYGVAFVLVIAGAYQLTPMKTVCLRACRSPLGFLMGHWRTGYVGTLRLGGAHAAYCVGCCWALMVVLVAAGAMGLAWVVLVALAVFAEKVLPRGEWTARAIGIGLVALGVLVVVRPDLSAAMRGASTVGLILDERASADQQQALTGIASGQAGGPMAALGPLLGTFAGAEVKPITFKKDGNRRSVSVPEMLDIAIEGVTGANGTEPMHLENAAHPVAQRLALAKASRSHLHGFGIDWDDTSGGNNGHFAPFSWSG